jgi:hypothetical protein
MPEGFFRQGGHMAVRFQLMGRLIKSKVSVPSQSQDAKIYGALMLEAAAYPPAFLDRIPGIGPEGDISLTGDSKWIQQLMLKVIFAGNRMVPGDTSPFIQFKDTHPCKSFLICPGNLGQLGIQPFRRTSGGCT